MIVVDQTVLIPFLFRTSGFEAASRVSKLDSVWVVPSFWRLDLLDQIVVIVRGGKCSSDDAYLRLLATEMLVRESHEVIENSAVLRLALESGVSLMQSTYVLTARKLGASYVTADAVVLKTQPDVAVGLETFGAI